MFKGKKILITGGTGSLGQALSRRLLKDDADTIRIFSRNENKQVIMESEFNDDRLRFFIGDVRDLPRLQRALEDVDIVFHAAALKHVPVIEYNPFEGIKTNVMGTQNVIEACLHEDVETAVGIGTDKAVSPLNTYGATKLLMEKLFVTANYYLNPKRHRTKFISLRYGNVLGSSGSVVPKFIDQIRTEQKITLTSRDMTRFNIMMDEALDFILDSTIKGKGGEIFVPKIRAYSIMDLIDALSELLGDVKIEDMPIRPGEKLQEILINEHEMRFTWENDSNYIIMSPNFTEDEIRKKYPNMKKMESTSPYSSDTAEKFSKDELKQIIKKAGLL